MHCLPSDTHTKGGSRYRLATRLVFDTGPYDYNVRSVPQSVSGMRLGGMRLGVFTLLVGVAAAGGGNSTGSTPLSVTMNAKDASYGTIRHKSMPK